MRVAQIMAGAEHGGAELFFERLVIALAQAGVEQEALIRTAPGRAANLRAAGVKTLEAPFGGLFDLSTHKLIQRRLDAFQPDVALCWMSRAAQKFPARRKGRLPVLCARLGGYYSLKYYRHCDHLIGNTKDICSYIRAQGWPESRVHYLPNFADANPAPPVSREVFQTPGDAPLLLAMGRLHKNKGFDVLLAALCNIPRACLWLAGEGPEDAALRDQAARLGLEQRVRFLGWRDDAPALLAAADILVCPSRIEPLGNVVIEAWAQGVPVVASRAKGPVSLIGHNVSGLLVDIEDAGALAAEIRKAVNQPELAAGLASAGRAAYLQNFTREAVVQRYQAFFMEVAG